MSEQHLWAEHPYYCSTLNYHTSGTPHRFESWAELLAEWDDADADMNLLFRFDWLRAGPDWSLEHDELRLFYMLQRKGDFLCVIVRVSEADEPAIRAWLQSRFDHLKTLWEPLT